MSLTNSGLIWGPLVCTFCVILLYFLKCPLLVFFIWRFCTNMSQIQIWSKHSRTSRSQFQRCSNQLNIFALALKFGIVVRYFKISFIVSSFIGSHCCSDRCSFTNMMLRRSHMVSIQLPYDSTGSGDPYPRVFIQCFNGWDPMANELCSHGLNNIFCDVCPTARLDISPRNDG